MARFCSGHALSTSTGLLPYSGRPVEMRNFLHRYTIFCCLLWLATLASLSALGPSSPFSMVRMIPIEHVLVLFWPNVDSNRYTDKVWSMTKQFGTTYYVASQLSSSDRLKEEGSVVTRIPNAGHLLEWLQKPRMMIVMVALPIFILIALEMSQPPHRL